jgi:hypothetical protein
LHLTNYTQGAITNVERGERAMSRFGPNERDGLPWHISLANPLYRASLDQFHEVNDEFERQFRAALKAAVEAKDGLSCRFLDKPYDRLSSQLPWLSWDDDGDAGYWVASGLEHRSEAPPSSWRTFLWLHYLRPTQDGEDFERDERPFSVHLEGESARNAILLARMVVDAASLHRLTLAATVEVVS